MRLEVALRLLLLLSLGFGSASAGNTHNQGTPDADTAYIGAQGNLASTGDITHQHFASDAHTSERVKARITHTASGTSSTVTAHATRISTSPVPANGKPYLLPFVVKHSVAGYSTGSTGRERTSIIAARGSIIAPAIARSKRIISTTADSSSVSWLETGLSIPVASSTSFVTQPQPKTSASIASISRRSSKSGMASSSSKNGVMSYIYGVTLNGTTMTMNIGNPSSTNIPSSSVIRTLGTFTSLSASVSSSAPHAGSSSTGSSTTAESTSQSTPRHLTSSTSQVSLLPSRTLSHSKIDTITSTLSSSANTATPTVILANTSDLSSSSKKETAVGVSLGVGLAVLAALLFLLTWLFYIRRRRRYQPYEHPSDAEQGAPSTENGPRSLFRQGVPPFKGLPFISTPYNPLSSVLVSDNETPNLEYPPQTLAPSPLLRGSNTTTSPQPQQRSSFDLLRSISPFGLAGSSLNHVSTNRDRTNRKRNSRHSHERVYPEVAYLYDSIPDPAARTSNSSESSTHLHPNRTRTRSHSPLVHSARTPSSLTPSPDPKHSTPEGTSCRDFAPVAKSQLTISLPPHDSYWTDPQATARTVGGARTGLAQARENSRFAEEASSPLYARGPAIMIQTQMRRGRQAAPRKERWGHRNAHSHNDALQMNPLSRQIRVKENTIRVPKKPNVNIPANTPRAQTWGRPRCPPPQFPNPNPYGSIPVAYAYDHTSSASSSKDKLADSADESGDDKTNDTSPILMAGMAGRWDEPLEFALADGDADRDVGSGHEEEHDYEHEPGLYDDDEIVQTPGPKPLNHNRDHHIEATKTNPLPPSQPPQTTKPLHRVTFSNHDRHAHSSAPNATKPHPNSPRRSHDQKSSDSTLEWQTGTRFARVDSEKGLKPGFVMGRWRGAPRIA